MFQTGIFITVCLSTLLIVAELALELGVDVTSNCTPVVRHGSLIDNANPIVSNLLPWHVPDIELSAYSLLLQMVKFRDGEIMHVSKGFPRRITNDLCVKCLPKPTLENTVASNCTVGPLEEVQGVSIGVMMSNGALLGIVTGINVTKESGNGTSVLKEYQGAGDLIQSVYHLGFATFFSKEEGSSFSELSDGKQVQYWEYANQEHISHLVNAAFIAYEKHHQSNGTNQDGNTNYGIPNISADAIIIEPARGPVYRRNISCTTNRIYMGQFIRALLIYRTIQMDNIELHMDMMSQRESNRSNNNDLFDPLTVADVYRAILAVKIGELMPETEIGEFFEYPRCASYNWIFAIPTLTTLFLINALGLFVSSTGKNEDGDINGGIKTPTNIENALNLLRDGDSFLNSKAVSDGSSVEWNGRKKGMKAKANRKDANELSDETSVANHDNYSTKSSKVTENSPSIAGFMSTRKQFPCPWHGNQTLFSNGKFIMYLDDLNKQSPTKVPRNQEINTIENSKDSLESICSQSESESEISEFSISKNRHNGNSITNNISTNPDITKNIYKNENVNSFRRHDRRFGKIPWLKEANQIVFFRDQYNEVSGLQVLSFEESPAGQQHSSDIALP